MSVIYINPFLFVAAGATPGAAVLLLSSIDELDPPEKLLLSGDVQSGTDGLLLSGDMA